jgi:hypothetical protein
MANSKIIIDFVQVPDANSVLCSSESLLGLNLNAIFKNARAILGEVLLPQSNSLYYTMTIDITADVSNIDVEFTPQGGNTTRVAFSNLNFRR